MKYICVDAEELQIMQRTDCSHINYSDVISKYRVIVCFYLVLGGRYSIRMSLKTPQRVIVTPHSVSESNTAGSVRSDTENKYFTTKPEPESRRITF